MHPDLEQLKTLTEYKANAAGAHLIDFVQRGDRGMRVYEIFIDSEEGVTTELCAEVSCALSKEIDALASVPSSYRLEVSSPGIGRELKFGWQYKKHVGRMLQLKLAKDGSAVPVVGKLKEVDDAGVVLETGKKGEPLRVAFDEIIQGVVKAPW